jgi:hypothetical protein
MTSMAQDETAGPAGAIAEQRTAGLPSRQIEVDLHSREAFEMLRLGEAIVSLRGDLRTLRLEKEDLRFDRDRYRASAAQTQSKLVQALRELDQNRISQEEMGRARGEIVQLARDCEARVLAERHAVQEQIHQLMRENEERINHERHAAEERIRSITQSHHEQIVALSDRHEQEIAAMREESDNRLRQATVSLALECAKKTGNPDA